MRLSVVLRRVNEARRTRMRELKGNVFDIQRYSIHDGDGIRTVVFLKGCPLRCKWCANPESQSSSPQLFFSPSRCIGCASCVRSCKNNEMTWEDGKLQIHWDRCNNDDLEWTKVCPAKALIIKGEWMSVEEVMTEIEKDRLFYEKSKGGVTLSGGEPLAQSEFAAALLEECKEKGIHTAIETTGYVKREVLEQVIPFTDLFLYDFKVLDSAKHKKWTNVENGRILKNLKYLAEMKADIIVRTPLIPGVNDSIDEIKSMVATLKKYGIKKYDILPFHQYGSKKYNSCGINYSMREIEPPDEKTIEEIRKMILSEGMLPR